MADILIFTSTLLIGVLQVLHKLTYRSDNSQSRRHCPLIVVAVESEDGTTCKSSRFMATEGCLKLV
jgi:hypothetical protein